MTDKVPSGYGLANARRIETTQNAELSAIIPVAYGALLSYIMYVIGQTIVAIAAIYGPTPSPVSLDTGQYLRILIVLGLVTFFIVKDVGEVTKLAKSFPFRRTSRYTHEIVICLLYLVSVALLERGSVAGIGFFGAAIFWGGIWSNQLRQEYRQHLSRIADYAQTQRAMHYIGGATFIAEAGALILSGKNGQLDAAAVICFGGTYLLWLAALISLTAVRHGRHSHDYIVNTVVPDRLLLWICERADLKGNETQQEEPREPKPE